MLSSVSNVSFKAQSTQDLINSPGRFTRMPEVKPEADQFTPTKKKSKAPAIIGTIAAVAVAAAVTLGILAGKGKLPEGTPQWLKATGNFLAETATSAWKFVAENAKKGYGWVKGLLSKPAAAAEAVEAAATAAV